MEKIENFIKSLDPETAVLCTECEHAKVLFSELNELGYRWATGKKVTEENTGWGNYGSDVCYFIDNSEKSVTYSGLQWAKEHQYRIQHFKDILEASFGQLSINQVWEISRKFYSSSSEAYSTDFLEKLFYVSSYDEITKKYSICEICEKIYEYEKRAKFFDVGRVVKDRDEVPYIVIAKNKEDGTVQLLSSDFSSTSFACISELFATEKSVLQEFNSIRSKLENV